MDGNSEMHAISLSERTIMCKRTMFLLTILTFSLAVAARADLEGYWKFDEGSGSVASDSSGKGRNGTIVGAAWHLGGWDGAGHSLNFDGVNDLVELGAFDVVGSGITLAAWIRPDDFEINGSRIISKANEFGDDNHWWMLDIVAGDRFRFRLKTTDGLPTTTLVASSGGLVAGQWQHAAATWNGSRMRVYLDGVQTGSVAKGGAAVATDASVKVAIGSQPSDAFDTDPSHVIRFYDGLIDEVQVHNEALSAAQIRDLINGVLPGPVPPANDRCANAQAVGDVKDLPFDTSDATFDGPGLCLRSPNIWYCYTATCTGEVTVSLLGSSYDTMLAVYDGCACNLTSGDLIACNDDFGSSLQSQVTFEAIAGNRYLIEVGGFGSGTGQGILNIACEQALPLNKTDLGDAPDRTNNFGRIMHAYTSQGLLQVLVPANFPTVFDDGSGQGPVGPVHLNENLVAFLGEKITRETEADIGPDEDGINNIRPMHDTADHDQGDDGVVFPINLPHCRWATIDYLVTVIDPSVDLWVNIWLDFNRDGDWDDTLECPAGTVHEWAVRNQYLYDLPAGLNKVTSRAFLSWHPNLGRKDIWMRITLSEQPWKGGSNPGEPGNGGSGPITKYEIGETEDYFFVPDTTDDTDCPLCVDFNGDGVINLDDLAAITAEWLATCQ